MASPPKSDPPSYFNINPEKAAQTLSAPIDTARFAKAAAFAARGRDDLAKRGYAPDGRKRLRKFSTWEVCRYLLNVAPAHLLRVLKGHPDLPQGIGEGNSRWFTLEEVLALREHFATEGAANREYKSWRPEGLPKLLPLQISKAVLARPRPLRILLCQPRSTATRCWLLISTARGP